MSRHNLLVELEMEENPVKGSPPTTRPNPKPRKRREKVVGKESSLSHENLLKSPEHPKPKPRRRQRNDYEDDLSSSSATNDERNVSVKARIAAFDNPVFLDDEGPQTKKSTRRDRRNSDSVDSSPSIHSFQEGSSSKQKKPEPSKQSRPRKISGVEDFDASTSESEHDSYLYIENEVKQKDKSKTTKVSGQLLEINYESPKRTGASKSKDPAEPEDAAKNEDHKSPKSREKRRKEKKGHVAIEIEKESAEQHKFEVDGENPIPPEEAKEVKKSSGKIGGLVGRWKNLLSSKSSSKETTEAPQEEPKPTKAENTEAETSKEKEETLPTSPKDPRKPNKKRVKEDQLLTTKSKSKHTLLVENSSDEEPSEEEENIPADKPVKKTRRPKSQHLPEAEDVEKSPIESTNKSKRLPEISKDKLKDRLKSITSTKQSHEESKLTTKKKLISSIEVEEEPSPEKVNKNKKRPHRKETKPPTHREAAVAAAAVDKNLLFGVTIHGTDLLPLDPNVLHPVVKVTVMNQDGTLLRKSSDSKLNNEDEETGGTKLDKKKRRKGRDKTSGSGEVSPLNAVLPIMTQPFSFTFALRNPSFSPSWNELLLYEEPFGRFTREDSQAILFFEIMDFLPMDKNSPRSISGFHGSDAGWYKVAWAFLKPVGSNGHLNIERKLRLQLYKPMKLKVPKDNPPSPNLPEVYSWWKSEKKVKLLNTTLYVTVKGVLPPQGTNASLRQLLTMKKDELAEVIIESQLATQKQQNKTKPQPKDQTNLQPEEPPEKENVIVDKRHLQNWRRLEGQSCRIPNKLLASLPSSQIESLNITISGNVHALKFSPCGLHLAAGLDTEELHVVLIFEIPSGTLLKCLKNHHGLIYDLDWKQMDVDNNSYLNYIASASADSTAVVWSMKNDDPTTLKMVKTLHHPSFVYCVKFHPTHPSTVVTGCYDCLIRVWSISTGRSKNNNESSNSNEKKPRSVNDSCPLFILDRHGGFVNSLAFDRQGLHLFSGDGEGCVLKWTIKSPTKKKSWKLDKDAKVSPHKIPVNSLSLHPNEGRLLVHLRDNSLKILDTLNLICIQSVGGLVNDKLQIRSSYSPCGNLILSGSENPTVCIWDADTSSILQFISPPNHPNCFVSAVEYHPHDFYVAVGLASSICEPTPILLYGHNQPNLHNIAALNSSVAKFKSNLLKSRSRSMEDDLSFESPSKTKKHVRFAAERGDSSEKFIAIINKLDKALQEVQEPRRHQMTRSVSLDLTDNNANSVETDNQIVDKPMRVSRNNNTHKTRMGKSLDVTETDNNWNNATAVETEKEKEKLPITSLPARPPRKASQMSIAEESVSSHGFLHEHLRNENEDVQETEIGDLGNEADFQDDLQVQPAQSYVQIHKAQILLAPPVPQKVSEVQLIEKLSPRNLPKPRRRPPSIHSSESAFASSPRPLQEEPLFEELEDSNDSSDSIEAKVTLPTT